MQDPEDDHVAYHASFNWSAYETDLSDFVLGLGYLQGFTCFWSPQREPYGFPMICRP